MSIAQFAAGALIALGVIFAFLGFLSAGSIPWVAVGLLAILAGGVLGVVAQRR